MKEKLFKKIRNITSKFVLVSLIFNAGMFGVIMPDIAKAADTGFVAPDTSNSSYYQNTGWTNPNYVSFSNNSRASADSMNDVVVYKKFGFNIPNGSKINGIEVKVEGYTSSTRQTEIYLSWNGGTSFTSGDGTGVKTTNLPVGSSNEASKIYGSPTDLWGRTWSYQDFSSFALKLDATSVGPGPIVYVDQLAVKVYYTENAAPSIPVLTSPADEEYITDNTPTLDWEDATDPEGDSFVYSFEIGNSDFSTVWSSGSVTDSEYQLPVSLGDGTYYWRVKTKDSFNNESAWSSVRSFTIDTNAPEITNISADPSTFSPAIGDTTNIYYTTSDNLDGDLFVSVGIWDATGTVLVDELVSDLFTETQGSKSVNWDGTGYTNDGAYMVKISAKDSAGNCSEKTFYVYVDTKGPAGTYNSVIDATNPTNNNDPTVYGKYYGLTDSVAVYASESSFPTDTASIKVVFEKISSMEESSVDGTRLVSIKYWKPGYLDGLGQYTTHSEDLYVCEGCPVDSTSIKAQMIPNVTSSFLPDGTYKVTVEAYDSVGNMTPELVESAQVIDTKAPEMVKNLVVIGKTATSVSLKWDAVTDAAGYKVYYGTSEGVWTGVKSVGNVTSYTVSGLNPNTNYFFKVVAFDAAMNDAEPSNIVFDKTNEAPVVLSSTASSVTGGSKISQEGQILGATDEKKEDGSTENKEEKKEEEKEENKNNGFNWWWIILLMVLAVGGYYYYTKNPAILGIFKKKKSEF